MKKSFLVLVVILAGLSGLALGIAAARVRRIMRARPASSSVKAPAKNIGAAAGQSDEREVIRFASNPQPVPAFDAKDLDGASISTTEWKGKVVLVTFWATWCPPCREEIPMLIGLKSRYKDRLQIVGVSLDDDPPSEVKQFAQKEGINYPVVMATRKIVAEFGGVPALPTSFVVNQDGKVVQKHVGLYPPTVYDDEVRSLLGLPVDATVETFEDTGQIFLKNASLATELPDVDLGGLTPDQKRAVLKRLNSETCNCGCTLTLAECRMNDTSCPISKSLAAQVVKDVAAGKPAAAHKPVAPATAPPKVAPVAAASSGANSSQLNR